MKKNIDKTMKKNSDIKDKYRVHSFSASDFYTSKARLELENHYHPLLEISSEIDRKSVSFQLSKNASVHGWLKYREGFSANLVNSLLKEFNIQLVKSS